MQQEMFADIVFPLPVNHAFTYHIPPDLRGNAKIGSRVIAPFGSRKLTGFITGLKDESGLRETKDLQDILDLEPILSDEIIKLAKWISSYYLCSLGEALKVTLPTTLLQASKKFVEPATDRAELIADQLASKAPRQAQILRYLSKSGKLSVDHLKRRIGAGNLFSSINQLEANGLLQVYDQMPATAKPKCERFVRTTCNENGNNFSTETANSKSRAPKQVQCLEYLHDRGGEIPLREVLQKCQATLSSIRALEKKGYVELVNKEVQRDFYQNMRFAPPPKIQLNEEQSTALREINLAIERDQFEAFLLFGVTGSGKTQVYIEALYKVLAKGKQAIVLVPEISLTPQTVRRFRVHFKEKVAVLHSAMSVGERYDSWRRLKQGAARVAIGPRSAIFAPLENVGLIVVDEEQESSYKQSDSPPRYHARDVAVVRAQHSNAVVVLGSATPSAESYHNTQIGKYRLLELKCRIDDVPLPAVEILDLRKEKRLSGKKGEPIFSRSLAHKIEDRLAKKEQIILLLNRRGFSSFIKCKDCGYVENCEKCQITLTYHKKGHRLRCHYCGFTEKAPEVCPECTASDILFLGHGTQRVEEGLAAKFPSARVVRMDLDTTSRKWAHDRILRDFESGKYDILLGTQMVAKGLDFQRVTLVGVINADTGLLFPDFRASERTFQLLTQVAGRAGRKDLPGEVVIQTYSPDSFCLSCARSHDFVRFYDGEVSDRRVLLYPPFARIICILFKGKEEPKVIEAARKYADVIKSIKGPLKVLGPIPSPIAKIQNKYRWQILIKGGGRSIRQGVSDANRLFKDKYKTRGVDVAVDVDPVSLI